MSTKSVGSGSFGPLPNRLLLQYADLYVPSNPFAVLQASKKLAKAKTILDKIVMVLCFGSLPGVGGT